MKTNQHRVRVWATTGVALIWVAHGGTAIAQLGPKQAVFTDLSGTCGVVDAGTMSVVATFTCDSGAEAVDVTSDGTRAVIGSCFTDTIALVDLTTLPAAPVVGSTIASGVSCVQELDIAPNDVFGIAPGSADGLVSKFTLVPFAVTGTNAGYGGTGARLGSPQDVHVDNTSTEAVHPFFDESGLPVADVTGAAPALSTTIVTTTSHHGISLNQADNDTILATSAPTSSTGVTVASLIGLSETTILATTGGTESVDIKCDGSRAVVETTTGLDWIDMTTSPLPTIISTSFGSARTDTFSTSTVAFSQDGSLLFVGGGSSIDVYDATTDPPTLLAGSPISAANVNVATLPCNCLIQTYNAGTTSNTYFYEGQGHSIDFAFDIVNTSFDMTVCAVLRECSTIEQRLDDADTLFDGGRGVPYGPGGTCVEYVPFDFRPSVPTSAMESTYTSPISSLTILSPAAIGSRRYLRTSPPSST